MKKLFLTTIFCGALVMPALAQDEMTTCAEFTEMDAAAQTSALASIQGVGAAGVDTDATASVEGSTEGEATGTATEDMTAEATEDLPGGTADADAEVTASAVADACADNPDMLVLDAIEEAQAE